MQRRHDDAARPAPVPVTEREITAPVSLTLPDGRLNRDAVGWTRTPLITTDGIGRGLRGLGRNKRWEYWAVTTPTHVVALVVSAIDYAAVHSIWVLDRRTGEAVAHDAIAPLTASATLPGTLGGGKVRASTRAVKIAVDEVDGGTRLRARGQRLRLDVIAHRPDGHECLGVVVPWTDTLFQYTVKDVARPATGTVWVDDVAHDVPAGESWATLEAQRGARLGLRPRGLARAVARHRHRRRADAHPVPPQAVGHRPQGVRVADLPVLRALGGPRARRRCVGAGAGRRRVGRGRAQPLVSQPFVVEKCW